MKVEQLNIGLLGQGAIGSLLSYYFRNLTLTIFVRSQPLGAQSALIIERKPSEFSKPELLLPKESELRRPKTIIDLSGEEHLITHPHRLLTKETLHHIDILLITVKAYQTAQVAAQLKGNLNEGTQIILIQNGMGGHEILHKTFVQNEIYAGITTDAIYPIKPDVYKITSIGKLDCGLVYKASFNSTKRVKGIKSLLSCHPNAEYHQDIRPYLYNKLAINAVINPLTALKNITNGELLNYQNEYTELINEVVSVFDSLGVQSDSIILKTKIEAVMESTRNNYSSMHQDFHNGRQTEIDSMLGYLIRHAERANISVPFMREIYEKVAIKNA